MNFVCKRLISFACFLVLAGCNGDGDFFEKEFLEALGKKRDNYCAIDVTDDPDPVATCESSNSCQALLDSDLNYLSCIPVLTPTDQTTADGGDGTGDDNGTGDGSGAGDDTGAGDNTADGSTDDATSEDQDNPGQEYSYLCDDLMQSSEKKVLICHFPPGNHGAAHTLCIGEPGWLNGHEPHHDGDHLGACNENDF